MRVEEVFHPTVELGAFLEIVHHKARMTTLERVTPVLILELKEVQDLLPGGRVPDLHTRRKVAALMCQELL